eukprot:8552694-Pyramimonas_sp.AAC.1
MAIDVSSPPGTHQSGTPAKSFRIHQGLRRLNPRGKLVVSARSPCSPGPPENRGVTGRAATSPRGPSPHGP